MKVNVEINSKQIFEEQEESESNMCQGEITYHNNGTVLEFTEKYEEQEQSTLALLTNLRSNMSEMIKLVQETVKLIEQIEHKNLT